jgi:hypothetical protein
MNLQTPNPLMDNFFNRLNKGFIEVFDDLIPEYLQTYYLNLFKSNTEPLQGFSYFYSDTLTSYDNSDGELGFGCIVHHKDEQRFHPTIFSCYAPIYLLCNKLNLIPFDMLQTRAWIQIQQPNSKTYHPHVDTDSPHYVLLYYVNDTDGDTVFFDNYLNEIKRISPKKGRVVFFDGSIYHAASNPTINPRFVLNYNFLAFTNEDYNNTLYKYKI